MLRKLAIIFAIALLAFTAACGPSSSSTSAASGSGSGATAAASASPGACPATETKTFAKTLFVADVALAGGAFKRYIYTPAKEGKFEKGAPGKVVAIIKAAAAAAFAINRLDAAKTNAQNDPTLCKLLIAPVRDFSAALNSLISKAKGGIGTISPTDVDSGNGSLSGLHTAAAQGGAAFTDNTNTNA